MARKQAIPVSTAKRWLPLAAIAVLMAIGFSQGWYHYLTLDALVERRTDLQDFLSQNYLSALVLYALAYVVVVAISLPGASVMTIFGGFLFGWLVGGTVTLFAATAGATIIFCVARTSFGEMLEQRAGPFLGKLAAGFREDAFSYLLFLRLVPVFPFWLVNLAPAFLGVSTRMFVLGTLIGILPGTYAFAFIGSGLDSIIEAQQIASGCQPGDASCHIDLSLSSLVTPELIAAFVALGVLAVIPAAVKHLRARKST